MKIAKKQLALCLVLVMLISCLPMPVYAAEALCEHHTIHTEECGYIQDVKDGECTFECAECTLSDIAVLTGVEINAPVIHSVTLDKTTVVAGESVTVTMNVTDESDLREVHVTFDTPLSSDASEDRITVKLSRDEDGLYRGTLKTDESFANGNYYAWACVATDIYGNREQIKDKSAGFEMTGGHSEINAPVINSVTLDKSQIVAGETVTVTVDVTDESDLREVHVTFDTPLSGDGSEDRITVKLSRDEDGLYRGTLTTDETFANGNYYAWACVATDIYGNREQIKEKSASFEMTGGHSEINAPVINSVTLDKVQIVAGETVTVTADVTDESDLREVHVTFDTPLFSDASEDRITVKLSRDEDGLYRGTLPTDESFVNGNYYAWACVATDIYGNREQIKDKSACFDVICKADKHIWAADYTVDQEATCTEEGYQTIHCENCSATKDKIIIEKIGHSYGDWTETTASTCIEKGTEIRTCSCGETEIREIEAKGHIYTDDRDASCDICGAEREIAVESVPMYRMYDPNSGEHFYSGAEAERDFLMENGWQYEGVGFNFPKEGAPVHRLYDPVDGEHLYTMDEAEKETLMAQGWIYEGVAFNSAGEDEVPQYRLHNPNAKRGGYHFTGSAQERDLLISAGWIDQGIGWYSCWE